MANQLRMWGPAALWAAVLFLLSAWPNPAAPSWLQINDKVVHFALFAVLGAALGVGRVWSRLSLPHWLIIGVGMAYGAADEWHQASVPGRTPSVGDWYADVAGVVCGYFVVAFLIKSRGRSIGAAIRMD